jgi:hypothetical protein
MDASLEAAGWIRGMGVRRFVMLRNDDAAPRRRT